MVSRYKSNSDFIKAINKIQADYNVEFPEKLSKQRVHFIVNAFLKEIESNLSEGNDFSIQFFGRFYTKFYEGKEANNPVGRGVKWESRYVPGFTPAKEFKGKLKNKIKIEQTENNNNVFS